MEHIGEVGAKNCGVPCKGLTKRNERFIRYDLIQMKQSVRILASNIVSV